MESPVRPDSDQKPNIRAYEAVLYCSVYTTEDGEVEIKPFDIVVAAQQGLYVFARKVVG